ncbi:MAG: L-arginine dehydrogenase [Gaiellales bacterium]|nr:L-arginine dehydrogenase [Gaiellales bacterium]
MTAVRPSFPVLDASQVAELIPRLDIGSALRQAFLGLASGSSIQPPQTLILLDDGADAIVYAAAVQNLGVIAVKTSPYIPSRTPPVTAWTMLMSTQTGEPQLLCDSAALTGERTAATTALAVDLLAPTDAMALAVVGAGSIAAAHLRHVLSVRSFAAVKVFSRSLAQGDEAALARVLGAAPHATVCRSAAETVHGADVVLLCTSSGSPVIDVADTAPSALITSISTNKPRAHEISPEALGELAVYCDYRATAPVSAGEMVIAQERGPWSPDAIVADLPELVAGKAPPRPEGRAFFRSIGLAIEDAAVAAALLRAI